MMTIQNGDFTKKEVTRSFRKFNDLSEDLLNAEQSVWWNHFNHLLLHCETDSVMNAITSPLKDYPGINANKWWGNDPKMEGHRTGEGEFSLPTGDDERTAILFQTFLLVRDHKLSLQDFCYELFYASTFNDMFYMFNKEMIRPFTRELSYRLEDIEESIEGRDKVSRNAMIIFNHHNHSTNISGNVQGSIVATANAQVKNSHTQFNTFSDIASELRELKSLAAGYSKTNQKIIEDALDFLASAAEHGKGPSDEITEQLQTVSEISPNISSRLESILTGAAGNLLSSGIVHGLAAIYS